LPLHRAQDQWKYDQPSIREKGGEANASVHHLIQCVKQYRWIIFKNNQ
jgi:hypothetical protein